jgi:hypothetical protein
MSSHTDTTNRTTTAVNGQWLSLKTGSSSYALAAAQTTAARFFSNLYNATGTYAVHNSDDTRQIVLQGASAPLLYLLDATNPRTDTIPKGQLMEWATFTTDGNVLGVKDGSTLTSRTFAAVKQTDGSYTLALYDGKYFDLLGEREGELTRFVGVSKVDATVTPVTINLVKAT